MAECVDEFKFGCLSCGDGGHKRPRKVIDTQGSDFPVLHDIDTHPPHPYHGGIYAHNDSAERGGTKTIGAPVFVASVTNPLDDVLRNPDGSPVLVDGHTVRA